MSHPIPSLWESRWCSPLGPLRLWASERGLARLDFDTGSDSDYSGWAQRYFGIAAPAARSGDEPLFAEAIGQLAAYFAGQLRQFELPLDLRGTPFQLQVWQAVCAIPWGTTCSYGQIAAQLGRPAAMRAVGAANGANPVSIIVPCHRLIGANGALRGYGGGLERKAQLLELERANTIPL